MKEVAVGIGKTAVGKGKGLEREIEIERVGEVEVGIEEAAVETVGVEVGIEIGEEDLGAVPLPAVTDQEIGIGDPNLEEGHPHLEEEILHQEAEDHPPEKENISTMTMVRNQGRGVQR